MTLIKWFFISLFLFLLSAIVYPYEVIGTWDNNVTLFFEKVRTPLLNDVFLFISDIGSIKYILPICFVIAVILLIRGKVVDVVFIFVMLYSVRLLNYQLKELFLRERPPFNAVYEASHYSFPSGHSMNSMATYSFLCFLLIRYLSNANKQKMTLIIITTTLILLIGLSRVYLGVHYLTDVVSGFSAGFAWFIVVITIFAKINQMFDKKRFY
jgi:undecaprenyl-diphosphatase